MLTELYDNTKAMGRQSRVPHLSVWFDEVAGWRASCGGVFCDTHTKHVSPEEAVRSAFANADRMAERFMETNPNQKKGRTN
jgi:hypothetical protein